MDRRELLKRYKFKQRYKMKKDWHNPQHFLPEGPEDDGPEGLGCEEWGGEDDYVTFLEDFCDGFSYEQKIGFLRSLGFNIISRKDKATGDTFDVAYSPDSTRSKGKSKLPAESNIDPLFQEKIGDCILKILCKYGK